MKKLWWLGLASLLIVLAGCAGDEKADEGEKDKEKEEAMDDTKVDAEGAVLDLYLSVANDINAQDSALNAVEHAFAEEDPEVLKENKEAADYAAATEAAEKTAEAVRNVEVADDLGDYKEDFQAVLDTLAESYDMKAEELKKEADLNFEAADAKLTEAEEKLNVIFEEAGHENVGLIGQIG
ncbi:hypothetical protein WAK64_06550 [Bacillus spongiae]|uniref:Lipoprotein n=1 Tax=Bacillus spongiae TaxID=2683610 RepID=A0ABU8HBX0_9BACI